MTMEKMEAFFEDDARNVTPENGLPSGVDPTDFGPEMPPSGEIDASYKEGMAKIRKAQERIAANKKETMPELTVSERETKLNKDVDVLANKMLAKGFPVLIDGKGKNGGCIDINQYNDISNISAEIVENDKKEVEKLKRIADAKLRKNTSKERINYDLELREMARQTEVLTFLLLNKAMGNSISFFRASEFDDWVNGADLFCIDSDGNPLAAFDVGFENSERAMSTKAKQIKVSRTDKEKFGTDIKHGLVSKNSVIGGDGIIKGEIFGIPLFKITFTDGELKILGDSFNGAGKLTKNEEKKINNILADIYMQIDDLRGKVDDRAFNAKCDFFDKNLGEYKSREDKDVALAYREHKARRESQRLHKAINPRRKRRFY